MTIAERSTALAAHPLAPLSEDEVRMAVRLLKAEQKLGERTVICSIALRDPVKAAVAGFVAGTSFPRDVDATLLDRSSGQVFEVVVSLDRERVVSWTYIPGVQPGMTLPEFTESDAVIKAHPDYVAALARRGVTDLSLVSIDQWPNGNFGFAEDGALRLTRALSWVRRFPGDNAYARPIDGVIAVVDLNAMQVVRIEDHGVVPLPPEDGNYAANLVPNQREGPRKLDIIQPDGPSFELDGHSIRWQKWQIRFGFTHREGLVLYTVGYEDQGRVRSILSRASLSEMVVPYGDPDPMHNRKNAFDAGEYGLGMCTNSLELGCDCLGEIRYFDGVICDASGEPVRIPNAICLHEEDYGILWKHVERDTGAEVRRSRRLVLSSIATVGNYEYGFFWYFYQDGSIEYEIKLTGIVSNGAIPVGEERKYGTVVAPGVYAPIHQHFFSMRLDMAIDGEQNTVHEVNTVAEPPGLSNPFGNAFFAESTELTSEAMAHRDLNLASARYWKVVNPNVTNRLGQPVAYKLAPGENTVPFNLPGSSLRKRAGFADHHLWVTPFDPGEMHGAGQYPNQHAGGAGLPTWTAANRSVKNTDVVVWYTMGHNHVPRPEDWPVMPTQYMGFKLQPLGFFDRNPALDVPPSPKHGDHCD